MYAVRTKEAGSPIFPQEDNGNCGKSEPLLCSSLSHLFRKGIQSKHDLPPFEESQQASCQI